MFCNKSRPHWLIPRMDSESSGIMWCFLMGKWKGSWSLMFMRSYRILKSHTTSRLSRIFMRVRDLSLFWKGLILAMDSRIMSCIMDNKSESESTLYSSIDQFTCTVNPSQSIDTVKFQDSRKPYLCWSKITILSGFSSILIPILDWKWLVNPLRQMIQYW